MHNRIMPLILPQQLFRLHIPRRHRLISTCRKQRVIAGEGQGSDGAGVGLERGDVFVLVGG